MPLAATRLFFDNSPASDEQLSRFGEIRVDQAIGVAAEAELEMAIDADSGGRWSGMEEGFAQPFARIRVEVKVGDGNFTPLIDGPIVGQRFELDAAPGESRMVLVVHDDSVLLNQEEKVALYENMTDSDIASALIAEYGLTPEVSTTPGAGATLQRTVVQRGTNMQLLRELARRHGMFAYVRPGDLPGRSTGVFEAPRLSPGSLPELLLLGRSRNVNRFSAQFDALRPVSASAGSVTAADKQAQSSQTQQSGQTALGDVTAHTAVPAPGKALLARTREEQADIAAAAQASADQSAWAYSAEAEVDADTYPGVLAPYQVVRVAGAGGHLSGDYLIGRVTHVIGDGSYRQQFTLRRNARSAGANAGGAGVPGGIF